jgi:hypothetical protein
MPKKSYRKPSRTKERYREYLESSEWEAFKQEKAKEEPRACRSCPATKKIQLHHMIYRDLPQSSRLEDTIWLCVDCHMTYHAAKPNAMKRNTPVDEMIAYTLDVITRRRRLNTNREMLMRDDKKKLAGPAWAYAKPENVKVQIKELRQPVPVPKPKPRKRALSSFSGIVVVHPAPVE